MAASRHLVFALDELISLGLTRGAASRRARASRLHRVHQGVYSLVAPTLLTKRGHYRAATLAASGSRHAAALSHRSAADLHGLRVCQRRTVEVIVPGRSTHRHPGIETHRSIHLHVERDLVRVDGIAVTSVARTALDLAAVVAQRALQQALNQAEILRVFDLHELLHQIERNPNHPGAAKLRAALTQHTAGDTVTDSELEEFMYALLAPTDIPRPEHHGPIDPGDGGPILRPDFVWRPQKVLFEVDGVGTHLTRQAFEEDRRRDQRLTAAGWRVIRVTWRQLHEEPERILRLLAGLLGLAGELGVGV